MTRPRRPRGGSDDGSTPRRRGGTTTAAPSVRQAQQTVTEAAQRGRPANVGTVAVRRQTTSSATTQSAGTGGVPPGHRQDAQGNLHAPNGRFARDPNRPPRQHDRSTEYPRNYSQRTLDAMATRYTVEGQAAGGVPRDRNGDRIPHERLNWVDEKGRPIPYNTPDGQRNLTFDHKPPVVDHWRDHGRFQSRAERNAYYDNPANLRPRAGPGEDGNFADGASMRRTYSQETGPGYSE